MTDNNDDMLEGRSSVAVGLRLQVTRDILGLRQYELGARVDVKPSIYNKYELGNAMLRIDVANRICDEFDLSLDWLYRGDLGKLDFDLADSILKIHRRRQQTGTSRKASPVHD